MLDQPVLSLKLYPRASEASKWVLKIFWRSCKGDLQGKICHLLVCMSVTLNSSLSLEARELKVCVQTLHINAKKITCDIFEFCLGGKIWCFSGA